MSILKAIDLFLDSLRKKGFSKETILTRREALGQFLYFCKKSKIEEVDKLQFPFLQKYMAYVFTRNRIDKEAPLSASRKRTLLISLKLFIRFLFKQNQILHNPLEKIKIPLAGQALPSSFLAESKIQKILKAVNTRGAFGLRDRAILEMFYSSGIRRSELVNLKIDDIDFLKENLWVRASKNNKDRVVPIGKSALKWVRLYLEKERPALAKKITGEDERFIFLGRKGTRRLSLVRLGELVREYRKKAKIENGSCHLFRHAMATHMLANGADIRYIQEILGHSSISTTQIYTKVEITQLQKEYERAVG